jgi:flavin-dependent dehydrogenase
MLLARRGHKVLLVDRAKFPSDVPHSTLWIHQPGVQLLRDWGVLDQVIATGCPAIRTWHVQLGELVYRGAPPPAEGGQVESYAPRRYLLDQILADAAVAAGAEFRDGVAVEEIVMDGDRVTGIRTQAGTEHARVVIGADGIHSRVAAAVRAPEYLVREPRLAAAYTYFSDVALLEGVQLEIYAATHRAVFAWPTNHGQIICGCNWQAHELEELSKDPEGGFFATFETLTPDLYKRLRAGKRVERFITGRLPKNFFRKPYGPGWALAGDAGAAYEYSTAHGITNALRQAQLLADALDEGLAGRRPLAEALADFERIRNEIELPYYDYTYEQGTFQPIDPSQLPLYAAVAQSPRATSGFFGLFTQTTSPAAFFAPDHLASIASGQG